MLSPLPTVVFVFAVSAAVLQPSRSVSNECMNTNGSDIFLLSNATGNGAEMIQFLNMIAPTDSPT